MNKFKHIIAVRFFALAPLLALVAGCAADADSSDNPNYRYIHMGVVKKLPVTSGLDYYIIRDDGAVLDIKENLMPNIQTSEGQRVMVRYDILGYGDWLGVPSYSIKLYTISDMLLKDVVRQTEINGEPEIWEPILGSDPIKTGHEGGYIWISGRYLNVELEYYSKNGSNTTHTINLVFDDVESTDQKAVLKLRHNAEGDVPSPGNSTGFTLKKSIVSFDLLPILPEGAKRIDVMLSWEEFDNGWSSTKEKYWTDTYIYNQDDIARIDVHPPVLKDYYKMSVINRMK